MAKKETTNPAMPTILMNRMYSAHDTGYHKSGHHGHHFSQQCEIRAPQNDIRKPA